MAENIIKYILDIETKGAERGLKEVAGDSKKAALSLDKLEKESKGASSGLTMTGKASKKSAISLKSFTNAAKFGKDALLSLPSILQNVGESMFNFTRDAVDAINRLNDLSTASNLSASTIQAVSLAFEASGQSASQADTFVKKFPQRLADIRKEGSDSNRILKQMGIEIGNAADGYRSSDEVFKDIITTLQNMEDAELRTAAAQRIFKRDVGNLLVALGNTGPIENFIKFTEKFGVDTKKSAADAAEFQQKLAALGLAFAFARDRIVESFGGYKSFNKLLSVTIGAVVFAAEMIRLFSNEFITLGNIITKILKFQFKPLLDVLKGLQLLKDVGFVDNLANDIQRLSGAKAGTGFLQNFEGRLNSAKAAAAEAREAIAGFNKTTEKTGKSGKTAKTALEQLKELFAELDKEAGKDAAGAKKTGKSAAEKAAERLIKAQEKAKEKLADLMRTLEMGDITLEGALKKTGGLIRLFEKLKMPIDPITNFKAELESQIFQNTQAEFAKLADELNNIDLSGLKQQFRIAAIEFGVNITEAISGSFQAVQTLVTQIAGPLAGAITSAFGSISGIGQQLKEVGQKAVDVEKERRVTQAKERIEAQRGRSLSSSEMKQLEETAGFLTAKEQEKIIRDAQLKDARMRVQNFVEGFAVALEVLPAILINVLPRAIGLGVVGLLKAIFNLPATIGNEFQKAVKRLLESSRNQLLDFVGGILDTGAEIVTLGQMTTKTYDRRSGGYIPSARSGMMFTGAQKSGLALLHENEFVVPASGQKPQTVERTMKQNTGGITVNVSGMVVESNAVDQIVREIERRFSTFGSAQSTLFGGS
jgi:hypothetical protein